MPKYLIPLFLLFLCFIMPIQIYIIGDGIGVGTQAAFYRYQDSPYGSSFIPVNRDVNYIITGIYGGKTALSTLSWLIGDIMLVFAAVLSLIGEKDHDDRKFKIICSFLMVSGILFLISVMLQYGIFLHADAGISIPFGVPLIIISGWYFFKMRSTLFL
jgi:hypothetical protein